VRPAGHGAGGVAAVGSLHVDVPGPRLGEGAEPTVGVTRRTKRPGAPLPVLEIFILAGIALIVRLIHLDHAPYVDELNHALAARSLLADGSLSIHGGEPYTRAWIFTYLVAGFKAVLGQGLVVGRLPAVVAGLGLVLAVFVWVRSVAGRWAGWTAALLLGFAPVSIYLSQQVRFYTLHALLFWVGAVAVYAVMADETGDRRRLARLLASAIVAFVIAYHLTPLTAVGLAAVLLWVALDRASPAVRWLRAGDRSRRLGAAGALLAGALLVAVGASDVVASKLRLFGYADLWAASGADNPLFYHWHFVRQYPTLWTLFPVALIVAASRFRRQTLFLGLVFGTAFLFHSFAAWKHERYIYYAFPFFFAVWGLAAAVALPWLRERLEAALGDRLRLRVGNRLMYAIMAVALAGSVLFAAAGNTAAFYAYRMLTLSDADWRMDRAYRGEADWQGVLGTLQPLADASDVVVASSMLKSIYYLGRVDLGLSAGELRGAEDFAVARKEAVPVVSRPGSLRLVHSCFQTGLVIADARSYRRPWGVTDEAADYLEANMEAVPFSAGARLVVFRWSSPATDLEADCSLVRPGSRDPEPVRS
jgi:hypothetical protein